MERAMNRGTKRVPVDCALPRSYCAAWEPTPARALLMTAAGCGRGSTQREGINVINQEARQLAG
eukprot:5973688-Pyramimonas_sp.AAC.1